MPSSVNVETTAQILDELRPGWHRGINLADFNLVSYYNCVVGQLNGDFFALDSLNLMSEIAERHPGAVGGWDDGAAASDPDVHDDQISLGLMVPAPYSRSWTDDGYDLHTLEDLWRQEITARRALEPHNTDTPAPTHP